MTTAAWRNPTAADPIGRLVVILAIVSMAFNDLPPLLPIGELQNDAFIYMLPVMLLYLFRHPSDVELPLPFVGLIGLMLLAIAIGIAINADSILAASFKGRSGVGRIITQSMVLAFGLLIVLLFNDLARRGFVPTISLGARIAVFTMAFFGVLEIGSWVNLPGLTQVHGLLGAFVHGGTGLPYANRLRMTAFEVSWAGVMLTFFFPFGMIGLRREWHRFAYVALVLAMVVLTQSRTALLVILLQTLLMLWKTLSRRVDVLIFAALAAMLGLVLLLMTPSVSERIATAASNVVTYGRLSGPSVADGPENFSNVTRLASVRASLGMFSEHPFFGVGYGQYGFRFTEYLQAEDYRSWEVRDLYAVSSEPTWPATYSLHARLLAETGLVGYLVFLAMILPALVGALRRSNPDDPVGRMHLAVAMTLFGWLPLGISIDSFRFYGGWIAIGVGLALLAAERRPRPGRPGAAPYPAASSEA